MFAKANHFSEIKIYRRFFSSQGPTRILCPYFVFGGLQYDVGLQRAIID